VTYIFHAGGNEDHWQSVRRLSEEVGWTLDFDDETTARLRSIKTPRSAPRSVMTRAEFINSLIKEAKR
jgi:hypothetical protein